MNQKKLLITILNIFSVLFHVKAQTLGPDGDAVTNFQPSLAVVIGILSIMFSLTFLLLLYAKFCHRRGSVARIDAHNLDAAVARSASGLSGIDKTVIESLPFFRFSSLRGARSGLECAVCLSKFEEIEILRLLPKCKHAFHIDCVDQWLEKHSSCPLCRHKVCAEDVTDFDNSDSLRFLRNRSELEEDSNIELFVQREEEDGDDRRGSSRFSVGSSFRRIEKVLENGQETTLAIQDFQDQDQDEDDRKVLLHKLNHKIVVSDSVFKNRWSNVSSSDLMFLNSEMINDMSSNRFSELGSASARKDERILEIKNSSLITPRLFDPSEKRSMSDITALSRHQRNMRIRESSLDDNNVKEAKMRKLWLPIAKKTLEWFANREKRTQQFKNSTQPNISDV